VKGAEGLASTAWLAEASCRQEASLISMASFAVGVGLFSMNPGSSSEEGGMDWAMCVK
jgi:hypothetical protein